MKPRSSPEPGFVWRPRDRKTAVLTFLLLLSAMIFLVGEFYMNRKMFAANPFHDFFAIWSFAKIAIGHPIATLYDPQTLHSSQLMLGMPNGEVNGSFSYPPTFLIYIAPLAAFGYFAAYAFWVSATFVAYVVASCRGLGWTRAVVYTLVLAPTTAVCASVGQSGFLFAALLVGGARLTRSRPILAGILFGLLTFKPQFGLLVPVALVASRQWRCIASAAATFGVLFLVTSLIFGVSAWLIWLHALPAFAGGFYSSPDLKLVVANMPTVYAKLHTFGLSGDLAAAIQFVSGLLAAAAVWHAWRRWPDGLAVPVLLAATYLTTPYAFNYDLPAFSSAVILFAVWRLRGRGFLTNAEVVIMLYALAAPLFAWFRLAGLLAVPAFLVLLVVTGFRTARSSAPPALPVVA